MTTRHFFIAITMLGLSAAYADEHVDKADANGDGFVSLYELRAAHYADPEFNKRIEQTFERYDRNGDGVISADERRQTRAEMDVAKSARAVEPDSASARSSNVLPGTAQSANREVAAAAGNGSIATGNGSKSGLDADERHLPAHDVKRQDDSAAAVAGGKNSVNVKDAEQRAVSNDAASNTNESWIREMDTDKSGGASIAELIANGNGKKWFRDAEFHAADRNGDGELNASELAAMIRSLERRQR